MRQTIFQLIPPVMIVLLCFTAQSAMASQDPCVQSPLFSGNVVVSMPRRSQSPYNFLQTLSRVFDDFDRDGRIDLVYGSNYGSVVYFQGRTDWWDYNPPVVSVLPFVPPGGLSWYVYSLAAGDFNDDSSLDLAVGSGNGIASAQSIHILLGNGNGTFQAPLGPYGPSALETTDIGVADFNGDKWLDLMCCYNQTSVTVLLGAGNGTFPTFSQINVPGFARELSVADIDHDTDMDAVVILASPSSARILRNNGTGAFSVESLPPTPPSIIENAIGELNADGWADIVISTFDVNYVHNSVFVLLNDGTGHYSTAVEYQVANELLTFPNTALICADVDGDGRDEVVVGRQQICSATDYDDQLLVFHNEGDGQLETPPTLLHSIGDANTNPSLASADFNHDGSQDLIAANKSYTTLLVNSGNGEFLTSHGTSMGPSAQGMCGSWNTNFLMFAQGDVNGDGRFDLVGVREEELLECTVMLQDVVGAFTSLVSVPLPERYTTGLALADFNLDTHLDMAVCTQNINAPCQGDAVRVAFGNGDGTFAPWVLYHTVGKFPSTLAARDLNADSYPDLVVATRYGSSCPSQPGDPIGISVFLNNGDGSLAMPVQYPCGGAVLRLAIEDIDNDDNPDLAVNVEYQGLKVLKNQGNGTFAVQPTFTYPIVATEIAFADVNGDTHADMLVSRPFDMANSTTSGGIAAFLNAGGGTFQYVGTVNVGTKINDYISGATATDLDGDGKSDLISIGAGFNANMGFIIINLGHGDGTFAPPICYAGGGYPPLVIDDFDLDGRPDIGSPLGCSDDGDVDRHAGFAILYNRMCPVPDPCPADIAPVGTPDGVVNVNDLLLVIGNWVATGANAADINGDLVVNVNDLLAVIGAWGPCP